MIKCQTLDNKRPIAGTSPTTINIALDIMRAVLPSRKPIFFCCRDTAKKMDTDVGGAIMKGCGEIVIRKFF